MNYNELIVFVIRETGWSLEYVQKLSLAVLITIADELTFQKSMDDYKAALNSARIARMWAKQGTNIEDFIGKPPTREKEGGDICQKAKEKGIQLPKT